MATKKKEGGKASKKKAGSPKKDTKKTEPKTAGPTNEPVEETKPAKAPAKKASPKPTKPKPTPNTALAKASSMVEDLFGKDTTLVPLDEDMRTEPLPHVPSGSLILDYLIGGRPNRLGVPPCPGVPRGRISEFYGPEGSGKTTCALNVVRDVLLRDRVGTACYIDFEHALSKDFCQQMGIPVEDRHRFQLHQPRTLEEGMQLMLVMASAGVDVVVLDSVGAVVPTKNYEKSVEKQAKNVTGQIGLIARLWSAFIPRYQGLISQTGTALIAIAQMRQKIGDTYNPMAPQGGDVWKYYSSLRLRLSKGSLIQADHYDPVENKQIKVSVGLEVTGKVDKSKVSGSVGSSKKFYLRFGDGIDNARSVIEVATAHRIVIAKGSWFVWERGKGDVIRAQGAESFRQAVVDTPGALDELIAKVLPIIHSSDLQKPGQNNGSGPKEDKGVKGFEDMFEESSEPDGDDDDDIKS